MTESAGFAKAWEFSSLEEIISKPYEPPPWILTDLLPAESGLLCSGLPHSGKSLNWLAAGIESVTRHKVWNHFDASKVKRMLYIETEDPHWLVEDRVRGICQGLNLKPQEIAECGFGLACTGPFSLITWQHELFRLIERFKPDWVVLSTLQGLLQGQDWNEQKDMGVINAILVKVQRMCPLIVITHSPRGGQRRAAGTITQDANYLTLMHFEKHIKNGQTLINVEGDSKMGAELAFNLRMDVIRTGDRTQVRRVEYEFPVGSKRERVIKTIASHPGSSPAEIAVLCDCSERYVRELMSETKRLV